MHSSPCPLDEALILALDVDSEAQAQHVLARLGGGPRALKIGLQTLCSVGPAWVAQLRAQGHRLFLDLKLHEIPNSVAAGVRAAGRLGASLVTVHASAGSAVLRAAVAAAEEFPQLQVLALTVITSLRDTDLPEIGLPAAVDAQVLRLALLAADCGCHGIVASAQELPLLRPVLPAHLLRVTPGIQLPGTAANDQARVVSPAQAAAAGASHIILGRSISQATDPAEAWAQARAEFARGWLAAAGPEVSGPPQSKG